MVCKSKKVARKRNKPGSKRKAKLPTPRRKVQRAEGFTRR